MYGAVSLVHTALQVLCLAQLLYQLLLLATSLSVLTLLLFNKIIRGFVLKNFADFSYFFADFEIVNILILNVTFIM